MSDYKLIYCCALEARGGESVSCGELYYGELHQCRECSKKDIAELIAENERITRMFDRRKDELDMLRADSDAQKGRIRNHFETIDSLVEERDQLKAENEALRKDVERYRWLVEKADSADWEVLSHQLSREIDRRIDSAMKEQKG